MFGHWALESGVKKTVKYSEKHQYQKILLSKANLAQKLTFLLRRKFTTFIS